MHIVSNLLRLSSVVFSLGLVATPGCDCEGGLARLPAPSAELRFADDVTPPLANLDIVIGTVAIGSDGLLTDIAVHNVGDAELQVERLMFIGDDTLCPGQASEQGNGFTIVVPIGGQGTVDAAGSLNIVVGFNPSEAGAKCTVLEVLTNDTNNPRLLAVLHGTGDAPRLCADNTNVDFGNLIVGETKDETLTLTSCGTRAITVEAIVGATNFPPFSFTLPTLPVTLQPDDSIELPVQFAPTSVGSWQTTSQTAGSIVVTADDDVEYVLTLEGTALPEPICNLSILPGTLNLGSVLAGETATSNVILQNIGGDTCTLEALSLDDGTTGFSFLIAGGVAVGDTIDAGASVVVDVSFIAPASAGSFNDNLHVQSNDPDTPSVDVSLQANVPGDDGCQIVVRPATVNFGSVAPGDLRSQLIEIENISGDPCFLTGTDLDPTSDPGFLNTAPSFGFLLPGATKEASVSFRGQANNGPATGALIIDTNDDDTPEHVIPLSAFSRPSGICVDPVHVAFGETNVAADIDITISACGATVVHVTEVAFTLGDNEFSIPLGSIDVVLQPGDVTSVTVHYDPTDTESDYGIISVTSDDPVDPIIDVEVTGGPEIVPADAGRYLYFWKIAGIKSDVMRLPLQGNIATESYWGSEHGDGCTGCHRVSPDGRYIAVMEVGSLKILDTDSHLPLSLGFTFTDPTYFSWNPNVNTDPSYQFVYSDGADLRKGALFEGELGVLSGANDSVLIETMPTWGSNGTIAFARGAEAIASSNGGGSGLAGTSDILVVDENGGTPILVPGASENTAANYYPQFSPDGVWLAFTQSASASTTIAATDAKIRLVHPDGAGGVLDLAALNGNNGASSFPTWSVDGSYLSFSSNRSGGAGDWDIYLSTMDLATGADGAAMNLNDFGLGQLNTASFEHAAQWSP